MHGEQCILFLLQPGTFLDQKERLIRYSDFVNKELILFSLADLQRSIPSMVDGLKPGQRKILFCCFKRNFTKEAKVTFTSSSSSQFLVCFVSIFLNGGKFSLHR